MNKNPFNKRNRIVFVTGFSVFVLGFIDYASGYELNFFLFYFVPIAIAAWKVTPTSSYLIAVLSSIVWFLSDIYSSHPHSSILITYWNAAMRLLSFLAVAYSTSKVRFLLAKEREMLQDRLNQAKTLSGLIPICASCKKIRDDQGYWQQVEEYIEKHTNAEFTHGLCEECVDRLLKEAGINDQPHLPPKVATANPVKHALYWAHSQWQIVELYTTLRHICKSPSAG